MTTVRYPFEVSNGKVVMISDPMQEIQSKVVFCLSTQAGERVMNPAWGIDILNSTYSLGKAIGPAIDEAIRTAFRTYFPQYHVKAIDIIPRLSNPTYIVVNVRWGEYGDDVDMLSKVGVQLPDGGEYFQGEGF
jgi:phage baseplate assembly protein W